MGKAELSGRTGFISAELCDNISCKCKMNLDDEPEKVLIRYESQFKNERLTPSLRIYGADGASKVVGGIKGIPRPQEIAAAFDRCEGPVITDAGLVCGGIYNIGRK